MSESKSCEEWVLVRSKTPMAEFLNGSHAVIMSSDLENGDSVWEVIEMAKDGSATEWMRLLDVRDALCLAQDVMNS